MAFLSLHQSPSLSSSQLQRDKRRALARLTSRRVLLSSSACACRGPPPPPRLPWPDGREKAPRVKVWACARAIHPRRDTEHAIVLRGGGVARSVER